MIWRFLKNVFSAASQNVVLRRRESSFYRKVVKFLVKTAVFEADKGIRPSDFNLGNVTSGVSNVCFYYMLKGFFGYAGIKQRV